MAHGIAVKLAASAERLTLTTQWCSRCRDIATVIHGRNGSRCLDCK